MVGLKSYPRRIYLTGFMASGKSTVGRLLARKLGWFYIDLDKRIEKSSGLSVGTLFRSLGEPYFREVEFEALHNTGDEEDIVVATGGGALLSEAGRRWAENQGFVVCLRADIKTVRQRISGGKSRPLLLADASLEQIFARREGNYDSFGRQVATDGKTPDQVADDILALFNSSCSKASAGGEIEFLQKTAGREHSTEIRISRGLLQDERIGPSTVVPGSSGILIADKTAWASWENGFSELLDNSDHSWFIVKAKGGEKIKSWRMVQKLMSNLHKFGVDRDSYMLAMGGGSIIDFTGFVASTYMRGIPWSVIPTTLLSQVDSAIGGKTAINAADRKNLVGTFHFPEKVWIDPRLLESLPDSAFSQGMAEIIKAAFLGSARLVALLQKPSRLKALRRDKPLLAEIIAEAVRVKVQMVNLDPIEDDRRRILNLGHTTAHALEASMPERISHGDAVAVGMLAAALIAERTGVAKDPVSGLLKNLLARYNLPLTYAGPPGKELYDYCKSDKKATRGKPVWVLPARINKAHVVRNVSRKLVVEVFDSLRE